MIPNGPLIPPLDPVVPPLDPVVRPLDPVVPPLDQVVKPYNTMDSHDPALVASSLRLLDDDISSKVSHDFSKIDRSSIHTHVGSTDALSSPPIDIYSNSVSFKPIVPAMISLPETPVHTLYDGTTGQRDLTETDIDRVTRETRKKYNLLYGE